MSHLLDSELKRFQLDPETHNLARSLLHTAKLRTAPGSGHELGGGAAGLPAVCAYIACNRLNSTEVDLKTAQAASCIRPPVFKKTLEIAESVLKVSSSRQTTHDVPSSSRSSGRVAYTNLLHKHKLRRNTSVLLSWLAEVEAALLASGELRGPELKELKDGQLLRCAVFGWTCAVVKSQNVTHTLLKEEYDLQADSYDDLVVALDSACSHIADKIRQQRTQMQRTDKSGISNTLPTPTSSPTKSNTATSRSSSPTKSPSKSALKQRSSVFARAEQSTPTKRKVAFAAPLGVLDEDTEMDDAVTETPSKKAKLMFSTPPTSIPSSEPNYVSTARASSSRVTLDGGEGPDERMDSTSLLPISIAATSLNEPSTPRRTRQSSSPTKLTPTSKSKNAYSSFVEEEERSQPRRFRPIFLDHKQWFSRDPRIEREIKRGEEIKKKLVETRAESMIEKYRPVAIG